MKFRNLAYGASTVAIMLSASTAVFAQETTGGIRGVVSDASGAPVANAEVTVTHVPSGTVSVTATDQIGAYSARNLRVGGPYIVTVNSVAGSSTTEAGSIGIGTPASIDIIVGAGALSDETADLGDVVVTGQRAGGLRTSPRTNISLNDIETLPSISRDIKDFVRTSPFATVDPSNNDALSIGGQNTRSNAILVDGLRQSDDFGLNGNGYPTQRSPISIDALEAVSVDVAPYGVQYGSFTGGVINSVTKSGGNEFSGTAFWETTNEGLQGNTFSFEDFVTGERQNRSLSGQFEETTWGASLGGPIIKDRLFFFLNYENYESSQPVFTGPTGSGAANQVPGVTQADVDTVRQIARDVYGYDPLDWQADALEITDEKYFAKLDWNINDRHRAVVSYQQTEGGDLRLGGTSTGGNYPSLGLLSQAYTLVSNLKVYKGQLFSDWTDTFSTELSVSRKEVENVSESLAGNDFASMQIYLVDPTGASVGPEASIRLGPDRSRHANALTVDTTLYRAVANWDVGFGHRLTGGFEREEQDIFNLFVQVANGEYEFASIDAFRNRQASSFGYTNAASNNKNDGAAALSYALNTLFVQDEWQATEDLTVTAGLRFDYYTSDDEPQFNEAFERRYGFSNTTNLDGIFVLQPRFGFNWRASEDLTIYGGFGRFQGGSPNVWISNSYTNPGNLTGSFQCRVSTNYSSNFAGSFPACGANAAVLANVDGFNVSPIGQAQVTDSANRGTGNINLIDPSFETPSIWKTSLGVNKRFDLSRFNLGEAWNVTAEYVHSELENTAGWIDLGQVTNRVGTAPDGRPVYGPSRDRTGQQVLMLTNFKGGEADQFAIGVSKDWYDGWLNGAGFNFSYTYLDATDPSAGTSSTASSNFGNIAVSDPNMPPLASSNYEIEHALKLSLSYQRAFFGDYRTRFALFAQRRSGLPFSYTYSSGTLFGDYTSTNRNLLYVPQADSSGNVTATSDPIVTYSSTFNVAAFNDFLKQTGLIDFAGSISPRNAFNSPYLTTVDLHIEQELPAFFPGGSRLSAYLDIENFGNLLNDEWGTLQQIDFPYISNNIAATRNTANTQYTYTGFTQRTPTTVTNASVWQMKFGVRYRF